MLTAISRYGTRELPNSQQLIEQCRRRGEFVQGPAIAEFEAAFSERLDGRAVISTSYGRMAFYYILKALALPVGSEVIFPALTFWVVPEMARVLGLKPVFVDVDPATFNMNPDCLERAITGQTRVVVPTHLYGLPCDMDRILEIAGRHCLTVIEDCAHALGALYRGRLVGTLGDAALFSFQTLKPLSTYGGGMAVVRDLHLARRVTQLEHEEPWLTESQVEGLLLRGRLQRIFLRPSVFRWTLFPLLWTASLLRARPDVYFWEPTRRLDLLPSEYRRRYSNVQALLGLEGLRSLDQWTATTCRNAAILSEAMKSLPEVHPPVVPRDRTHVFYQYCVNVANRDQFVRACVRRGLDVETLHADLCTHLPIFEAFRSEAVGAERASEAVQLPVYSTL